MSPIPKLLGFAALLALFDSTTCAWLDLGLRDSMTVGYTFQKQKLSSVIPRSPSRLRRRQQIVQADISNEEIAYIINITIGTPPQPFSVQLDTGSADLWVPSVDSDACSQDQSCQVTGAYDGSRSQSAQLVARNAFQISYQDNSGVVGDYINDTITIGKTTLKSQTFGVATQADRSLGIMGIGYTADESIAQSDPNGVYPNIIQSLKNSGAIGTTAYSLWLNDQDSNTGSILFGGVDSAKYTGSLIALPVQKNADGSFTDFTVALSSFELTDAAGKTAYNQQNLNLPVILDSGTTDTYLPDNIAQDLYKGVGAVNDDQLGPIIPCALANSPAKFTFSFGGQGGPAIQASFGEFVNPVTLDDGGTPEFRDGSGAVCSFGIMSSGAGGDTADQPILLGDTFLRSAYVVYNLANNEISMAQTKFNTTDTHVQVISGSSVPGVSATATAVAVTQAYTGHPLETFAKTKNPGSLSTAGTSPTFNLGVTATHKGAAAPLAPVRIELSVVLAGTVMLLSTLLGGGFVLSR